MNSARKSYISKYLKQIETIISLTVFKYLLVFDKEFNRKLVNLISAGRFIKITMYMTLRVKMFIIHA